LDYPDEHRHEVAPVAPYAPIAAEMKASVAVASSGVVAANR
jgi:hypothetical protein